LIDRREANLAAGLLGATAGPELHTFGDDRQVEAARQSDDRAQDCRLPRRWNEQLTDLDLVERKRRRNNDLLARSASN